jgi:membrane protein YqaA with SNARE-associated domain
MLLVSTFAVAAVSAIVPLVNIEVYLGVVATQLDAAAHPSRLILLAATAGVAQTLGKLCWYLLAARSIESRWVQHKLAAGARRHRFDVWHARIVGRPWLTAGVLALSAVIGLPPLLVLSVVAGSLRVPLALFVPTVVVGRSLRFWAILAGVGLAVG